MNIGSRQKSNHISFFIFLFVFFLLNGGIGFAAEGVDLAKLDRYIEAAREDWKMPGLAVAIVKDGRVVLAKGYGVKEFARPDKVDEKTLFAIASNSKAFTSAALAMLADEGKIHWDDRVREYLPYFTLYDPYVTEEMRVRDLLCHRSGLRTFSGDLLWYETSYSPEEVVRRARYLKPAYGFRSGYGYSNIMFMAAGEIIAAVTGNSWRDFIKERIFTPLGMETTNIGTGELKNFDNVATPHYIDPEGKTRTIPYSTSDQIAAAGAINSNAHDMARWLIMLLDEGKFQDKQIVSAEGIWEMWTPHTAIPVSRSAAKRFPTHFRSAGLGWFLIDYHGRKVAYHGGGLDGMISRVALVPGIKLGLVVLTNSMNGLSSALAYKIIDTYLGVTPKDWSRDYLERYKKKIGAEKKQSAESAKKKKKTLHRVNPEDYTGLYGGPMYGDARVSLENKKLVLRFLPSPVFISELSHLHYDTFKLKLRNKFAFIAYGTGTVQFLRDKNGKVVEMKVDIPNNDFWFYELEFKKKE